MELFIKKSALESIKTKQLIYSKKMAISAHVKNHSKRTLKGCRIRFYAIEKSTPPLKLLQAHLYPKKSVLYTLDENLPPNGSHSVFITLAGIHAIEDYELYHWIQCK